MKNAFFHLSLPCRSVGKTREFYLHHLGAEEGRSSSSWTDINLFGNQITFTKAGPFQFQYPSYKFENEVLPSFHFGILLEPVTWSKLKSRLIEAEVPLATEALFLENKPGEHQSFFVQDPNGYWLEFKQFNRDGEAFTR